MATGRKKKNVAASRGGFEQLTIFDVIREDEARQQEERPAPGSFNISSRLRNAISEGLKRSSLSRYEVAARMSELVGVEITKSQLDSWTAESKEYHRFPAEYLPAFCLVTGHLEPLRMMARMLKCYVLESKEALLAELGRIDQVKRDLARREKVVREMIEKMWATG
ncbi:hypothetical protein G7K71_08470 [Desulfofundulus sp. TPOSR]|uniref:hypothetical protein n=1 Tax=Desulfofundulus sp. TPOSR TaxID=2714340 RepID=UPI001407ABEF|nr:hypothetical protein [Desulfofundulus sp. TPOSR]NHM25428.1 hypothetical protein [Desulfofundulus sp. TPOSR]NHM27017.1 hypothetical protein [Desulfofundulus sp. TPOSR]